MLKPFLPLFGGAIPPQTTPNGFFQTDLERKIKPIPRKISQIFSDPHNGLHKSYDLYDLHALRKKNIKIKNLEITNRNKPSYKYVHISENFSLLKRVAKYLANINRLQINNMKEDDFGFLNKLLQKIRYIRSFQTGDLTLTKQKNEKKMQRFLLRCKYLQSYKANLEVNISCRNQKNNAEKKENILLKFIISKKDFRYQNSQRLHRLLIYLRKHLSSLVSIENSKHSTNLVYNPVYNKEKKRFNTKAIQRLYSSFCVTSPYCLKDNVYEILSAMFLNKWDVQFDLEPASLKRKDCQEIIEAFLNRTNSKFSIVSSSFSWSDWMEMLNFSQRILPKYSSCFYLPDFIFPFHSLPDVKQALVNYFSVIENKWEKICLKLNISSLDYFNDEKRSFLEEMLSKMLEEKNLQKYSQVVFEVNMRNAPTEELFIKISKEIITLIEGFIQSLSKMGVSKIYILRISHQIDDGNDISFFLNQLVDIPNRINLLEMEFNSRELINKILRTSGGHAKKLVERIRKGLLVAENLRNRLIELKGQKAFEDFEILQPKELELLCGTLKSY